MPNFILTAIGRYWLVAAALGLGIVIGMNLTPLPEIQDKQAHDYKESFFWALKNLHKEMSDSRGGSED